MHHSLHTTPQYSEPWQRSNVLGECDQPRRRVMPRKKKRKKEKIEKRKEKKIPKKKKKEKKGKKK